MDKMYLALCKVSPEPVLLEKLRAALDAYEKDKTPENKKQFEFFLQCLYIRYFTESMSIDQLHEQMKKQTAALNLFKVTEN